MSGISLINISQKREGGNVYAKFTITLVISMHCMDVIVNLENLIDSLSLFHVINLIEVFVLIFHLLARNPNLERKKKDLFKQIRASGMWVYSTKT